MRRTYERGTKARLSFSGGPHAPVNMAGSMEEVNAGGQKPRRKCAVLCYISYAKFSQILEVLRDFHRLFGSRNSRTTGILHTIRHVYRSVWPVREAKPRFGTALERSAHDCQLAYPQDYIEGQLSNIRSTLDLKTSADADRFIVNGRAFHFLVVREKHKRKERKKERKKERNAERISPRLHFTGKQTKRTGTTFKSQLTLTWC